MAKYSVNAGVAAGTDLPIINCTGSAAIRLRVYEFVVGSVASPADVATKLMFERTTDAGTGGSALTVNKVDPLTVTATGTARSGTFATPPTDTDELLRFSFNQRATHRFISRETCEFVASASAANGIMANSESSTGTPTIDLTMFWEE